MLTIAPYVAWNNVEGELALFDSRDGTYHALNGSAAAIWRAIAAGQSSAEIVDTIAARFDAPPSAIAQHVDEFIAAALAKGLLEDPS